MSLFSSIGRSLLGGATRRGVGGGITGLALGTIAARIATRSVPGALLVGGGFVAKYLWDKKRDRGAGSAMSREDIDMGVARASGETIVAEDGRPDSPAPKA